MTAKISKRSEELPQSTQSVSLNPGLSFFVNRLGDRWCLSLVFQRGACAIAVPREVINT